VKVGVAGLWHLGSVTAACLAEAGIEVVGIDDEAVVAGLAAGRAPLFEPGLDDLIAAGLASGRLRFSTALPAVLADLDVLWMTYDTPIDDDDRADVPAVLARATALLPLLRAGALVLVSSQLPVGTTRRLRDAFMREHPGRELGFAYSPENLRLGKAIAAFVEAERVVVGCESDAVRLGLEPLLRALGRPVVWMGIESAEMVKHTINAFLATSVTFINEIAALCERVGADAGEVEAGIRSEPRIGPRAYVTPGGAFGGGTLARDVVFLSLLATTHGLEAPLIDAILRSNRQHGGWAFRRIGELLGDGGSAPLKGVRVAVLGLTYKPNTSALRRSTGLELCQRLHAAGAEVRAFDPAVQELPPEFASALRLLPTAADAFDGADALVIATEWPEFAMLDPAVVGSAMRRPIVLDPNGFVARGFGPAKSVEYHQVGKAG
jgi:UDPglucose 6-dehydrogenase